MKNLREKLNKLNSENKKSSPPSSTLRSDLQRLYKNPSQLKYFPKSEVEKELFSLSDRVPGKWVNTAFGDIFQASYSQDISENYGNVFLKELQSIPAEFYSNHFELDLDVSLDELLFIDTETTGLSGGSGTLAFMVGLAWFEEDRYEVRQYFISQLSHEEGMLDLLKDIFSHFRCFVSFNGKSYDIPLLNTRFIMNQLPPISETMLHIDLLHPVRALWKYSLRNCRLSTMESDLLNIEREEDIPGELIPGVYFDYLRHGNAEQIEKIFYHNRYDMITMPAVLLKIYKAVEKESPEEDPLKDFAKGKLFERKKQIERSIKHYKHVLDGQLTKARRQKTLGLLGEIYKKQDRYEEAIACWQKAIEIQPSFSYDSYVELAKYYEHKEKNVSLALKICKECHHLLPEHLNNYSSELQHRMERIQRKIDKKYGSKKR